MRFQRLILGLPPTNDQIYASNVPNSACTARNARALSMAAAIFSRLRTIPPSAITNARAFLAVQAEFGTFDAYIWSFVGGKPKANRWKRMADVPARTAESDAMSKDLKKRSFRFAGSTICYAFMQAVGMVNDHLVTCFRYRA